MQKKNELYESYAEWGGSQGDYLMSILMPRKSSEILDLENHQNKEHLIGTTKNMIRRLQIERVFVSLFDASK